MVPSKSKTIVAKRDTLVLFLRGVECRVVFARIELRCAFFEKRLHALPVIRRTCGDILPDNFSIEVLAQMRERCRIESSFRHRKCALRQSREPPAGGINC